MMYTGQWTPPTPEQVAEWFPHPVWPAIMRQKTDHRHQLGDIEERLFFGVPSRFVVVAILNPDVYAMARIKDDE
jgi:hypothetical protein